MLGKMPNVIWLEGAFVESVKGWQSGWFYITEPRDPKWAAAPEFRSGIPTQLTSWKEKGLLWGSSEELTGLQACIQKLVKKLRLVNVVQVMLVHRILPCQERAFNLWEFNPEQHQALSGLFDTTYEGAWRVLFKGAEAPASATEDRGFRSQRQADEVSDSTPLRDTSFSSFDSMRVLISPFPLTGLDEEGGADYLPGSHARKPSRCPSSEAAGSGTARGAGEEGQEGGHGCSKEFPFSGVR